MTIGLTLPQACGHSLAQLELLGRARARADAGRGLIDLQNVAAGVAAVMSKNGSTFYRKVHRNLKKQVEH